MGLWVGLWVRLCVGCCGCWCLLCGVVWCCFVGVCVVVCVVVVGIVGVVDLCCGVLMGKWVLGMDGLGGLGVRVYWNLHKCLYSVTYEGRVVAHVSQLFLNDVTFRVSEASRLRVTRDRRKNVHAFVCGTVTFVSKHPDTFVHYDPYTLSGFAVVGDLTGDTISAAQHVALLTVGRHPVVVALNVE